MCENPITLFFLFNFWGKGQTQSICERRSVFMLPTTCFVNHEIGSSMQIFIFVAFPIPKQTNVNIVLLLLISLIKVIRSMRTYSIYKRNLIYVEYNGMCTARISIHNKNSTIRNFLHWYLFSSYLLNMLKRNYHPHMQKNSMIDVVGVAIIPFTMYVIFCTSANVFHAKNEKVGNCLFPNLD